MRVSDFEFDNQERKNGYIYINEDKLEAEIRELVEQKENVELLDVPKDMSREAYLNLADCGKRVLKWYPFETESSLLEIGAGYGRLTEYLCENLKEVSVYEKKTERLHVIEARCAKYHNLTCFSGDLKALKFARKYDYILVHDIFAIARKFFKDCNPNVAMLHMLRSYLTDNGKLLLITENRLGLKYFAGATEDYSQQYFWGLRSFDEDERVRVFSKRELQDILIRSGFEQQQWYYLYPDIVNTLEVYSDKIESKIAYGITYPDYESCADRYEFFDEQRMFHTLYNQGIVSNFVNAFFVECSVNSQPTRRVYANLLYDYYIDYQEDKFLYNQGNAVPRGKRINIYLMDLVQEVVNCNLGRANPYINVVYDTFKQLGKHMIDQVYYLEDFYYDNGRISVMKLERTNVYGLEYYRWRLGYLWYLEYIMRYRNAKRRILLEDVLRSLDVDIMNSSRYFKILVKEHNTKYLVPRMAQNMFDFEAEAAKDALVFDENNFSRVTIQDELKILHSGMAGE